MIVTYLRNRYQHIIHAERFPFGVIPRSEGAQRVGKAEDGGDPQVGGVVLRTCSRIMGRIVHVRLNIAGDPSLSEPHALHQALFTSSISKTRTWREEPRILEIADGTETWDHAVGGQAW